MQPKGCCVTSETWLEKAVLLLHGTIGKLSHGTKFPCCEEAQATSAARHVHEEAFWMTPVPATGSLQPSERPQDLAGCTQPPGLWEMITYGIAVSCHWSWGCFDTQQSITRTETFPRNTGEPLLEWSFTISVFGHLLLKQWPRCVFSLNPPSTQAAYLLKASLCLSILMLLKILAVKRNV